MTKLVGKIAEEIRFKRRKRCVEEERECLAFVLDEIAFQCMGP